MQSTHLYEVHPRKDHRGVDLISDALPFGRLWYGRAKRSQQRNRPLPSIAAAHAKFADRSHQAVTRVYEGARVKKTHSAKRRPAMYCESKARSAPSTVEPIPTIPSATLGPSSAIQSPLRIDNAGRRAAEGLFGCVAQYDFISSNAIRAGSAR